MAELDIFQLTTVSILDSVPIANVFYLKVIEEPGPGDSLQEAADALESQVITKMLPFQSSALVYECILGRQVFPVTGPSRVFPVSLAGSDTTDAMPANVAIKFPHSSGIGNKNQRGRYFLGGLTKLSVNNGRIGQGKDAVFQAFIDEVTGDIIDSPNQYRMQHFSVTLNQFFDVDVARAEPVPVKMRNRTPGLCSIS